MCHCALVGHSGHVQVMVFDMGSLHIEEAAGRVQVSTGGGVLLGEAVRVEGSSLNETVFKALDAALATRFVPSPDMELSRVGLYNPFTAQVALFEIPKTLSFGDGRPLEMDFRGLPAVFEEGVLTVGSRSLQVVEPSTSRVIAAMHASV